MEFKLKNPGHTGHKHSEESKKKIGDSLRAAYRNGIRKTKSIQEDKNGRHKK